MICFNLYSKVLCVCFPFSLLLYQIACRTCYETFAIGDKRAQEFLINILANYLTGLRYRRVLELCACLVHLLQAPILQWISTWFSTRSLMTRSVLVLFHFRFWKELSVPAFLFGARSEMVLRNSMVKLFVSFIHTRGRCKGAILGSYAKMVLMPLSTEFDFTNKFTAKSSIILRPARTLRSLICSHYKIIIFPYSFRLFQLYILVC